MEKNYSDYPSFMFEDEEKKIEDLEARSKKLYELVVTEEFEVNNVIARSNKTSFIPESERIYGGETPSHYNCGFTSNLTLTVTPTNTDIPTRILNFDGFSIVKNGDYISAKIPKYTEERVRIGLSPFNKISERVFYLDRKFNLEESAIELALLSPKKEVLRRDRSIDYRLFLEK